MLNHQLCSSSALFLRSKEGFSVPVRADFLHQARSSRIEIPETHLAALDWYTKTIHNKPYLPYSLPWHTLLCLDSTEGVIVFADVFFHTCCLYSLLLVLLAWSTCMYVCLYVCVYVCLHVYISAPIRACHDVVILNKAIWASSLHRMHVEVFPARMYLTQSTYAWSRGVGDEWVLCGLGYGDVGLRY